MLSIETYKNKAKSHTLANYKRHIRKNYQEQAWQHWLVVYWHGI